MEKVDQQKDALISLTNNHCERQLLTKRQQINLP